MRCAWIISAQDRLKRAGFDPSAAATVILRNLTIDGAGTDTDAIFIASSGTTNVLNVVIETAA